MYSNDSNEENIIGPDVCQESESKISKTSREDKKLNCQLQSNIRKQLEKCLYEYVNSDNPLNYMKPRAIKKNPSLENRKKFDLGATAFFSWLGDVILDLDSLCGYYTDGKIEQQMDYISGNNPRPLSIDQIAQWEKMDKTYPSPNIYLPKLIRSFSNALCAGNLKEVTGFDLNTFINEVRKLYLPSITLKAVIKTLENGEDNGVRDGILYLYKTIDSTDIKLPDNITKEQREEILLDLRLKKNKIDTECENNCADYVFLSTKREKDWVDGFMQGARFITRVSSEYGGCGEIQDLPKELVSDFICNIKQKKLWQVLTVEHWANLYFNACTLFTPQLYHFSINNGIIFDNKYSIAEGWHLIAMRDMDGRVIVGGPRPGQLPLMDPTEMNNTLNSAIKVSKDKRESSYVNYFTKYNNILANF